MKFFLFLFFLCTCFIRAEVISTRTGNEFHPENLVFEKDFFSGDFGKIHRNDVQKVYFSRTASAGSESSEEIFIDGKHKDSRFIDVLGTDAEDPAVLLREASEFADNFPDAESLVIRDCGQNRLFPDGTRSYIYHRAVKILKESAVQNNIQLYWGEDRDRLKILLARVISPEGSVRYATGNDITVSESTSDGADFISQGKTVTISLPDVSPGCIFEYVYSDFTFDPFKKEFFFTGFGFEDYSPVLLSRYEVIIPADRNLYWACTCMEGFENPDITETSSERKYTWTKRNSAPLVAEPQMPDYYEIAANIKCSTHKDWKEFWQWEKELSLERMQVTPLLEQETLKIVEGCLTDREKLAKIFHWLQSNIRYISIKSGIGSGWSGHPAEMTLKNRYGDCVDKAILMATMLKICGIEAYPVSVMTKPGALTDLRIPHFAGNHAINCVYLNGERMTLDTTATTYRFPYYRNDDQGIWIDNYFKDEFYFNSVPSPDFNSFFRRQLIKINSDGSAVVSYRNRYTGAVEAGARAYWMYTRQDMWENELKSMISEEHPGSEMLKYEIRNVFELEKPFSRELSWKTPEILQKAGSYRILDFKIGVSFPETSLEKRNFPIVHTSSFKNSYEYIVQLPDNLKITGLPENTYISCDYADFSQVFLKTASGFSMVMTYRLKKDRIPVSGYQEYRSFTRQVEECHGKIVFLNTDGGN